MAIFDKWIVRVIDNYLKAKGDKLPGPLLSYAEAHQYVLPDPAVYGNQATVYQNISWFRAAVKIVSETVAATSFTVEHRVGEDSEEIVNHEFEVKLREPNPLMSGYEFKNHTSSFYQIAGNAYWWLYSPGGSGRPPAEIWALPPQRMKPKLDGRLGIAYYEFSPGGGQKPIALPTESVVHFKNFNPFSLFQGMSPVETLARVAQADQAQQEHNLKFFAESGGRIPGILAFKDMIAEGQWKELQKEVREHASKETYLLLRGTGEGDMKFTQGQVSRKDMEFLAGREFTKQEIYALVAAGFAAMTDPSANVASARVGEAVLMKYAIWPILQMMAEKITSDVLPLYGDNLVCVPEDVRMADRDMDLKEQQQAGRVITVNEAREKYYDMEPLPDGDPRGELLVEEVGKMGGPAPPFAELGEREGAPPPPQLEPGEGEGEPSGPQTIEAKARVIEIPPTENQKIRDALEVWERFVLNRLKAGRGLREFESDVIPAALKAAVEGALETVESVEDARLVFADALTWGSYP